MEPRYNTPTVAPLYREQRDFDDDVRVRQFFEEEPGVAAGECAPPMDVLETGDAIEILMDLPGVRVSEIRLLFSQGMVIIAGRKQTGPCAHQEAAFHLAERSFGRFARAIRLSGAFDGGRATASLQAGELRITLPRTEERRGRDIRIEINQS